MQLSGQHGCSQCCKVVCNFCLAADEEEKGRCYVCAHGGQRPQPPAEEPHVEEEWEDVVVGDVEVTLEVEPPESRAEESEEQPVEQPARQQCAGAADDAALAGTPANPTQAPTTPATTPTTPAVAPLAASNSPPCLGEVTKGDILAVMERDGSGEYKVGRVKQISPDGSGGREVVVAIGAGNWGLGFLQVCNYSVLLCGSVVSADNRGIIGGTAWPYDLSEAKFPVKELVHNNLHWETFGILGFTFCGREFYFGHR